MKKLLAITLILFLNISPTFAKKASEISLGTNDAIILKNFGRPSYKTVDAEGLETWIYQKVSNFSSANCSNFGDVDKETKKTILIIKFDENKTVVSYTYQKFATGEKE